MKKDAVELVCILDKSGSMRGLEQDTLGGYNAMLAKQKALPGDCRVTTVLFDTYYKIVHDRIDLDAISPLADSDYAVGGGTALLDAIGKTIDKMVVVQRHTAEAYRAEKVIFVIITDGEENSSRFYNIEQIRSKIEYERKHYGWEFIFLGANIDAIETAKSYGISADCAAEFLCDEEGVGVSYKSVSNAVSRYRTVGSVPADALDGVRRDRLKRGK